MQAMTENAWFFPFPSASNGQCKLRHDSHQTMLHTRNSIYHNSTVYELGQNIRNDKKNCKVKLAQDILCHFDIFIQNVESTYEASLHGSVHTERNVGGVGKIATCFD
jgi:hypothetical protein